MMAISNGNADNYDWINLPKVVVCVCVLSGTMSNAIMLDASRSNGGGTDKILPESNYLKHHLKRSHLIKSVNENSFMIKAKMMIGH